MEHRKCYLFFSGYYAVAAASDLLRRHGIENRIVKTPISMKASCNFAVLIDEADEAKGRLFMEEEKITVNSIEYILPRARN